MIGAHIVYTSTNSAKFMATSTANINHIYAQITEIKVQLTEINKIKENLSEFKTVALKVEDIARDCGSCYVKKDMEKMEVWRVAVDKNQAELRAQLPLQLQGIKDEIAAVREDLVKYTNEIKKLNT